jgi:hypothetical protein
MPKDTSRPAIAAPAARRAARRLLILLVPALLALAGAGWARAQSGPGVIAYSGVDHNIWRIAADGSARRQLTQDGSSDNPAWVPNGSQILFSSLRDQKVISTTEGAITLSQIYRMNSDGSAQTRLSDGSADDRFPEVIASGDRVIFLRNHNWRAGPTGPVRDTDVGSMRLDGTDYRAHGTQVTDQKTRIDRYPARSSSDGTKIVLIRQEQGKSSQIQVLDVASGRFNTVTLAMDRGAADGTVEYLWPRFDPQGHIVVLRRSFAFGPVDTRLLSLDTSGANVQTLISGLQFESLANGFDVNWPARTLVGARSPELPGGMRPEEIYLFDLAAGTAGRPLDSGHAPAFVSGAGAPAQPTATAAPATPPPGATPGPGGPIISTADPLFYSVWERVDRPVKEGQAVRSWVWGPEAHTSLQEPYGDSTRLVQYFDKARMERNPATDQKPAFVTNGLLVVEMLSGRVQTGPNQYETRSPATIAIGGDGAGNPAPSYAVLARVSSLLGENKAPSAMRSPVTTTLSADGAKGAITFPATERIGYYAAETGHNIPDVFFNFLNQSGKVYVRDGYHTGVVLDWVFTVGYPISEPYWTRMSIAGKAQDVMVQAFQRQILTYIPSYQPPWNVQFGNVGTQYFQWRYGKMP